MHRFRSRQSPSRRRVGLASLIALVILASCGEEIVVRQTTRVYRDGSLNRTLEIAGRTGDGEIPTDPGWFRNEADLVLADAGAWGRVEERPGRILAEGFFGRPEDVPVSLTHFMEEEPVSDRTEVDVDREDLVLFHRWIYTEKQGDPFGYGDLEETVEAIFDLIVGVLGDELQRQFGSDLDPRGAESFLRSDVRPLALELFTAARQDLWEEQGRIGEILTELGIVSAPVMGGDSLEILEDVLDPVLEWTRRGIAEALSTIDLPVSPEDLTFWPTADDVNGLWSQEGPLPPGPHADFVRLTEALGRAMIGYYGDLSAPSFRFEARLEMPGTLLRTNGTPDGRNTLWTFRSEDMIAGDVVLRAESIEPNDEVLVSLGARRDFDTHQLVELADLLTARDPEGVLKELVEGAVRGGRLDLILEEAPDEIETLARELTELLDPASEPWPAE